ncbi:MAG TPA: NYN domain-containing protein [Thermomicrobiales bacterium]|nr:NYN domain-containing protein [Thermomicrobiales bacterium]
MNQNGSSSRGDHAGSTGDDWTLGGDVALLIDYENLQISLKRYFKLTTPKMSLIIQEAQEHGRLVLARAYAPWTSQDLSIDAENLYRQGIDLIYVPAGKNSADVRIAVDAVETCTWSRNISTYVIVTGDGDLIHPLNYLRQQGRKVVVIGVDAAMSRMLSAAADAVLIYERDLDPSVRRPPARVKPPSEQTTGKEHAEPEAPEPTHRLTPLRNYPRAEEAFRLVQEVLTRHGDGEPLLYQEAGHWLGQDHGMRSRTWYGVPFSVFMDAAREAGYVELTTSGGNSYVSLPGTATQSDDQNGDSGDDDSLDDDGDGDIGSDVRLESLRPEEQRALFDALEDLAANKRSGYLTFRTILKHLLSASVLPRLSEWQIRRLLNDLANRKPPILIRQQKRGKTASGQPFTFSAFTLTKDASLMHAGDQDHERDYTESE